MRDLLVVTIHLIVTVAKLPGPGGVRTAAAGPKGPSPELIAAIVELKRCNPNASYPIMDVIALASRSCIQ